MKYNRTILIQNIKELMKNKCVSQATLASAINDTVPLSQGRVSLCLNDNKSDNFTIEQIVAIADFFKISIDSLLGIPTQETHKVLTGREICRVIANIIKCTNTEFGICEDELWHKEHPAIFFPRLCIISTAQQKHDINNHICKFLERIKDLKEMRRKGNLNSEMFDRLVESYLNDVPEEYYLTDIEIWEKYPDDNSSDSSIDEELPFPT